MNDWLLRDRIERSPDAIANLSIDIGNHQSPITDLQ
jgi:hypothetical protein